MLVGDKAQPSRAGIPPECKVLRTADHTDTGTATAVSLFGRSGQSGSAQHGETRRPSAVIRRERSRINHVHRTLPSGLYPMAKTAQQIKSASRTLCQTKEAPVQEILRTNDPVLISYARSLLMDAGIESVLFDSHIANMEGSVSAIPCRLMVIDADVDRAGSTLADSKLDW